MQKKDTVSVEKRKALKYLAGATGVVIGSALSKKWVSPSLHAAQTMQDNALSGDFTADLGPR